MHPSLSLIQVATPYFYPQEKPRPQSHCHAVICGRQVNADEMEYDQTDEGSYSHECRCGEAYVVSSAELREGFDVVGCLGCSLYIRVVGPSSGITESAPENDP